jgi:CDP-diglyceride synthetase
MTAFFSRILVGAIGLPVVLGAVWGGGWWLFALVTVAGMIAVHEFVTMARPLRPLAPAVYVGVLLALLGAHTSIDWMLGGTLATYMLAFVLNAVAKTRAPSTVAIGATVLGATWIGVGVGHIVLLV